MQLFTSHKFVIVKVDSEALLYLLFDKVVHHGERLAGAGCAKHDCGSERIDHVNPALVPLLLIVE